LYLGRNVLFGFKNGQKYTPTPKALFWNYPEKQNAIENRTGGEDEGGAGATINIEEADFLQNAPLRKAIHARERGHPSIKRPRQLRQEEISSASFGWPCRVSDQR